MAKDRDSSEPNAGECADERTGITRRALIKGAVAAAGAGLASTVGVRAQVTGVRPGGATIPYRLPKGALTYLDRKEYIHNMEIISFTPDVTIAGGEPLMNLWAKGRQRMLPAGGDGWLDISEPKKPVVVKSAARPQGCVAYNTRLKK